MNKPDQPAPKLKRRFKLKPLSVIDRLPLALLVALLTFGQGAAVVRLIAQETPLRYFITQSTGSIVSGTTDVGNHCDDCVTTINLPFAYELYGQRFTQAGVGANGILAFNSSYGLYLNNCLPSIFSYTIFAHWDDLWTANTDQGIFTATYGTAPNRTFVIEWRASCFNNQSQPVNFEIVLYENAPQFDIVYGQIDQSGGSATVGVQQDSEFSLFECNSGGLVSGLKLTFALGGQMPSANVDAYLVDEDTTLSVDLPGVLANDTDADGNTLTAVLMTPPAHSSSFAFNADGSFTYAPLADFHGTDSFTYKASDGTLDSDVVAVAITVAAVNDRPTFTDAGNVSIAEDFGPAIVSGWAGGINAGPANESGQAVALQVVGNSNPDLFAVAPAIDPNGNLTFAAAPNANGSSTIAVVAIDNGGTVNGGADTSVTHAFTITVALVNDPPTFTDAGNVSVAEDFGPAIVSGWASGINAGPANESGQAVTFQVVGNSNPGLFAVAPAIDPNGNLTFAAAPNANGSSTIAVAAKDNGGTANGGADTSVAHAFTITVTPLNDDPVATNDPVNTAEDTPLTLAAVTLLANDSDIDGDTLSIVSVSATSGQGGSVLLSAGSVVYTPAANFTGTDTFTYTLSDGQGGSVTAIVSVNVSSVNDAPFANAQRLTIDEDTTANIILSGSDVDGDLLRFSIVSPPSHGTLGGTPPNLTYTPAPDFFGSDSFSYTIADGNGGSATATVNVTVLNVNDAPVLNTAPMSLEAVNENDFVTMTGSLTDADPDDAHTVTIVWGDGTANEVINLPSGQQTFTATHQYLDDKPGSTSWDIKTITCTVSDGNGGNATVNPTVTVKNLAPAITGVTGPTEPLALGSSAGVSVNFTDVGTLDTHMVRISWDDGTADTILSTGGFSRSASHIYAAAGVYTVGVSVTDDDTGVAATTYQYIVVYDPSAGFVTGGGWIASPAGAYPADPALSGKASFGFVSKYLSGATTPSGQTQFQFQVANLNFHSTSYEWLVVSGPLAQYKGSGAVNGTGDYGFLVTATDGQGTGGGGEDKFRIKIWDKATGAIVYDNAMGGSEDINGARPQAIGGGNIVIQKAK